MKRKGKTVAEQILTLLWDSGGGPLDARTLHKEIPGVEYKTVSGKCIDLEKIGLVTRDANRAFSLVPGVTPETLITGEIAGEEVEGEVEGEVKETPPGRTPPGTKSPGMILDQRSQFIHHMTSIGVTPKEAIPTIADIFFSGDINSLEWLKRVLTREAAGYVRADQQRLILGWWKETRGLPYSDDEIDNLLREPVGKKDKGEKDKGEKDRKPESPARPMDPGMGWKVGKDPQGDWIPQPGGALNYEDALAAAERRALLATYGQPTEEGTGGEEGDGPQPSRRGGRKESPMDYMFKKIIDHWIEGDKGGGESSEVKEMRAEIKQMRDQQEEQRFQRLEGMIAEVIGRDPWDQYDQIQTMKTRLGISDQPIITDQSPAVQLIKDAAEKWDKNTGRLIGLVERATLRSGEFSPERTRSPEEREDKAGELLDQAQARERSRQIRRNAFGT